MLNVRDEFEGQLRLILGEIAQDHQLDSKTLIGKYLLRGQKDLSPLTQSTYPIPEGLPAVPSQIVAPGAPKAPRVPGEKKKGGRKPKFSTPPKLDGDLTGDFLRDLTIPLLKEACKMRKIPITGGKDILIDRIQEHQKNPQAPGDKKKGGRKKKLQAPEPEHNHVLDNKTHKDCPQCETYGNPMDPGMQRETFEIAAPSPVVAPQVPEIEPAAVESSEIEPVPVEPKEFEMGDEDIDDQLKNIVAQMNQMEMDSEEEDENDDEDPFSQMDYGDDLEEED